VRVSEWVVVVYLAYFAVLAFVRPPTPAGRWRALLIALPLGATTVGVSALPSSPVLWLVRFVLPMVSALLCYWLAGPFFTTPQIGAETAFLDFDRRVWPSQERFVRTTSRLVLEYFEFAYLGGYLILPAGFAVLMLTGRTDLYDRFWSAVLASLLGCYAVLPWVRTRPPWVLRPSPALAARPVMVRAFNQWLVHGASTELNTFPSGHAAGAVAAALVVCQASPVAGLFFVPAAISVAGGTVVGDYHYIIDALTGALVAITAWGLLTVAGV
jgi:membrane-associated phospholipid phosphatase